METQFIYNAKGGAANSLFDLAHKIISPETYQCNLCKITHGAFIENKKFRELKEKYNITLWHIDDYEAKNSKEKLYPIIIFRNGNDVEIGRINTHEINSIRNINALEFLLKTFTNPDIKIQ
ncbi:MAG: GTPase [Ignavibacteriales bacterium]|nr:GTPase [Ignavibacteriales bacterium]